MTNNVALAVKASGKTKTQRAQSLLEVEPILIALGYNKRSEWWNASAFASSEYLIAYPTGELFYSKKAMGERVVAPKAEQILSAITSAKPLKTKNAA